MAFPLAPNRLLLMMHPVPAAVRGYEPVGLRGRIYSDKLEFMEVLQVCREAALNSYRWIFERTDTRIGSNIWVPPLPERSVSEEVQWLTKSVR